MNSKTLQSTIDAACAHLEKTATGMGTKLSFDLGSVGVLEEILTALRDIRADQAALDGAGFLVGAYLGEILRRQLQGEWVPGTDDEGFAVRTGETNIFPVARVRKFIVDPDANGLVFFAEVFVSQQQTVRS
ncbi:hypothetical protein J2W34_005170 [Variovorax boronicumulans]|uniref:hypothetical protein n=1 Tax=Variovorax boronicumulans TaxID=436515 RepID=UPI002785425A|nr:hypothetical protein [Variovorax boronicumulans]MDQ0073362.1 hypothetical protein [Variovorax boronicumulans]